MTVNIYISKITFVTYDDIRNTTLTYTCAKTANIGLATFVNEFHFTIYTI